jgi:hypothetical protein
MESGARDARIHDIASRLRLPHLTTFVERVVVRHTRSDRVQRTGGVRTAPCARPAPVIDSVHTL